MAPSMCNFNIALVCMMAVLCFVLGFTLYQEAKQMPEMFEEEVTILNHFVPCNMPFVNNSSLFERSSQNLFCSVNDVSHIYNLFKSPYLFPYYLRQGKSSNICVFDKQLFTSCTNASPSQSFNNLSIKQDQDNENVCLLEMNNMFPLSMKDLETFANHMPRTRLVDKGTMVMLKQINIMISGGMPRSWHIPQTQYSYLFDQPHNKVGMTASLWVKPLNQNARNWLHVFGTTKDDAEAITKQQCPSIWIHPFESKIQIRMSQINGDPIVHTHPSSPDFEKNLSQHWWHIYLTVRPVNSIEHEVISTVRVVDNFGTIVFEEQKTSFVVFIALANTTRESKGLTKVNNVFSSNYMSRKLNYQGYPGFMLYDVRVTHIPYIECAKSIFEQGLDKLKASNGIIPDAFIFSYNQAKNNTFSFTLDSPYGMNNAFYKHLMNSTAYICPRPLLELKNNTYHFSPNVKISKFILELKNNEVKVTMLDGLTIEDIGMVQKNQTFILCFRESMSSMIHQFKQLNLSEAYIVDI